MSLSTISSRYGNAVIRAVATCRPQFPRVQVRRTGTEPLKDLQAQLEADLKSRPAKIFPDIIGWTQNELLELSLADFLPESFPSRDPLSSLEDTARTSPPASLPQGHHLVYFPAYATDNQLLGDGTDDLHSPGAPYTRRLWAGGSLEFKDYRDLEAGLFAGSHALCKEEIEDVQVKGKEGDEKIFVKLQRRIAGYRKYKHMRFTPSWWNLQQPSDSKNRSKMALTETRTLVFMREKVIEAVEDGAEKPAKILKPTRKPDHFVTMTPTPSLLFRFSALTFNAHKIHLDPQYAREVEGHRNIIVHGPLTLVIMLSVLKTQLAKDQVVVYFTYKNLAPLYADEEMKICVRKETETSFSVWIEGRDGGYAVKGTADIGTDADLKNQHPKHYTKVPKRTRLHSKEQIRHSREQIRHVPKRYGVAHHVPGIGQYQDITPELVTGDVDSKPTSSTEIGQQHDDAPASGTEDTGSKPTS